MRESEGQGSPARSPIGDQMLASLDHPPFGCCGLEPDLNSSYCPVGFARKTLGRFEEVIRPSRKRNQRCRSILLEGIRFPMGYLELWIVGDYPVLYRDELRGGLSPTAFPEAG